MFDFIVSDHFEYKGRGGRLSQKVTSQRFGSGTRAFARNYSFNDLGQPEAIDYPVCLEWPCENKAPQRTVNLGYTKGFLTEVENFASLSYQLGGAMVHEINHSNGVKWTQTINTSDRHARPSSIETTGVAGGVLDHLGSTRQVTNSVGAEVERHHFYPFGEEATVAQVPDVRLKYTGHERDRNGCWRQSCSRRQVPQYNEELSLG